MKPLCINLIDGLPANYKTPDDLMGQKWTIPIKDRKAALNRFTIQFDERMLRV